MSLDQLLTPPLLARDRDGVPVSLQDPDTMPLRVIGGTVIPFNPGRRTRTILVERPWRGDLYFIRRCEVFPANPTLHAHLFYGWPVRWREHQLGILYLAFEARSSEPPLQAELDLAAGWWLDHAIGDGLRPVP